MYGKRKETTKKDKVQEGVPSSYRQKFAARKEQINIVVQEDSIPIAHILSFKKKKIIGEKEQLRKRGPKESLLCHRYKLAKRKPLRLAVTGRKRKEMNGEYKTGPRE